MTTSAFITPGIERSSATRILLSDSTRLNSRRIRKARRILICLNGPRSTRASETCSSSRGARAREEEAARGQRRREPRACAAGSVLAVRTDETQLVGTGDGCCTF